MGKETSIIFACLPALIRTGEIMFGAGGIMTADLNHGARAGISFPVLPLLLVTSLLAIILLSASLYHCRCKLDRTREYLVRYINECLELRKQVPTSRRTFHFNPPGITSKEFIKIIENMLKRIMFLPLFALLALPLAAQEKGGDEKGSGEKGGGEYVFRFVPEKDMFYIPYRQNGSEMQRLCDSLSACIPQLGDGRMYVNVSSYAASSTGSLSARRMAYLRNSRVKTELITRVGLTEKMFVTDRIIPHAYGADSLRNVVVVTFPAGVEKVARIAGKEAAMRVLAYNKEVFGDPEAERIAAERAKQAEQLKQAEQERLASEHTEQERLAAEQVKHEQAEAERRALASSDLQSDVPGYQDFQSALSLRLNLLRWATLTPDLGLEWRLDRTWSILLNATWTSWSWSDKSRRYALWKISPELRHYIGKEKRGYLGLMYHLGEFNYKPGSTGKQGDYQGCGLTGGYLLKLNRTLSLDFHAAFGYTRADYDKYRITDAVRVRHGSETKNYWGINQLGVTLQWLLN